MKRFLIGALALSLRAGTTLSAQAEPASRGPGPHSAPVQVEAHAAVRGPAHVQVIARAEHRPAPKPVFHAFRRGQIAPAAYRQKGRFVDYRRARLHAPVRGYQWVRADNQYLLIALASGFIAQAVAAH